VGHFLDYFNFDKVDGVLADLGVSSHQLDEGSRGFSYRFDANLDMRMNESISITAKDILNCYDAARLQHIFSSYGELRNAKTLANAVIEMRSRSPFDSISSLLMLLERHYFGDKNRYQAQVFQALRIEVNDELGGLTEFLYEALARLKKGGRLVVMSYHSLEDRLVKNMSRELIEKFKEGESDFDLRIITRKPIEASTNERKENSRANSAKLRVIEKK
jgi:16S rRNA (cytosine1402-N4)-methyltransferase